MKKILFAVMSASLLAVGTVHADVITYNAKCESDKIIVSGTMDKSAKYVALELLEDGYTPGEALPDGTAAKDAIEFLQQKNLAENASSFSFEFPVDGASRKFNATIGGEGFTKEAEFTVNYIKSADFSATVSSLGSNMSTKADFETFLGTGNNALILSCNELPQGADRDKVITVMYESLKNNTASLKKPSDSAQMWKTSTLASMFNQGTVSDISAYANYLNLDDEKISKWYNHVICEANGAAKLTSLLNGKTYVTASDFDNVLKKALILTVVRYPNGAANIGTCLKDFSDVTGITQNNETAKYTYFAGKDYSDYDTFMTAFRNYTVPGGSYGGGGSGSGSGSGGSVLSGMGVQGGGQQTIGMKFIDLDTVPWAYKAIAALCDKGIISGRSETKFAPDEPVTREEFVKMCVCILSMENRAYGSNFNDSAEDAWYHKYINIAYEAGICNGIADGVFGVSRPVTREDMATLIYNMQKIKGTQKAAQAPAGFADMGDVSEYAKDAVSALAESGAVSGMGDNTFAPNQTATRAQAAVMLYGVLNSLI